MTAHKRKDGSTGYTAQIRGMRNGKPHSESRACHAIKKQGRAISLRGPSKVETSSLAWNLTKPRT
jgi:hypothetical protein